MDTLDRLFPAARGLRLIPPGASLFQMGPPVVGPEGDQWAPHVWFLGYGQFLAVALPIEGGCPVASDVVWSDLPLAVRVARQMCEVAAG